jgi:hypothetical protein
VQHAPHDRHLLGGFFMKNIIYTSRYLLLLAFIFLTGCSSTIQVVSQTTEQKDNIISDSDFLKNVSRKNVTLALKTGRSIKGKVMSLTDSMKFISKTNDTVYIQRNDIRSIADKHELAGVAIGVPVGMISGALLGAVIGNAVTTENKNDIIDVGSVVGGAIGALVGTGAGLIFGLQAPPTTYYEFKQPGEIIKMENAP